ncbi:MAG: DUF362 domain-containing protein [Candidatus Lokiarchaeota archaeon]|nr:DUF362 domain-containing protein [Candidatus Lokiarchaeota archaeon]MBD3338629.1 DUF362 domain-containing protein [Candidatus Lokiarchaeota archaeon]
MKNKSTVYWAPPVEIASLRNSKENMITNNLVKTQIVLDKILDNIYPGNKVGVKVHVGESGNTHYLRHDYVREVVKAIKAKDADPFLIETQGLGTCIEQIEIKDDYSICIGHRRNKEDHSEIAHLHGYTEQIIGAPLIFIDGKEGLDERRVKISGIYLDEISVAEGLFDFDKVVVISHFKGHPQAGFGGALKQLGIGCVVKRNKFLAHYEAPFSVRDRNCNLSKCNKECLSACPVGAIAIKNKKAYVDPSLCFGCSRCLSACPVRRAIKKPKMNEIKVFTERFLDNAKGVLEFGKENFRYINFAFDITLMCDCVPNPGMPIVPDLGIYGSSDPVAIDKACFDAEVNAPGLPILDKDLKWKEPIAPGTDKFNAMLDLVQPTVQFEAAIKNKVGNTDYVIVGL